MVKLVVTEKPSAAMNIAAALGVKGRKDGCIHHQRENERPV